MTLRHTQTRFRQAMLQPAASLKAGKHDLADTFQEDHIPLEERLSVYQNNIIGSLSAALSKTYPLIEALTGPAFLKQIAREFVITCPPEGGCIQHYGKEFSDFIAHYPPARGFPYLPDIANLERALNDAYYAPDDDALTALNLAAIPQESLTETPLPLRQSAHLLTSLYPLLEIRDFCLSEEDSNAAIPDLTAPHETHLLICRPALEVEITPLNPDEHHMLARLQAKETLGTALESTLSIYPYFDVSGFLQKHVTIGSFRANAA